MEKLNHSHHFYSFHCHRKFSRFFASLFKTSWFPLSSATHTFASMDHRFTLTPPLSLSQLSLDLRLGPCLNGFPFYNGFISPFSPLTMGFNCSTLIFYYSCNTCFATEVTSFFIFSSSSFNLLPSFASKTFLKFYF